MKLFQDGGVESAGYLAYLNIFSLFPLFIILGIAVEKIADTKVSERLIEILLSYVPSYSKLISKQIQAVINGPSVGVLSFASIGALWTTTSSLEGMRTAFNKIYKVKSPPFFIRSRLLSVLQFILILVALIITVFGFIILPKILMALESFLNIKVIELYDISYAMTLAVVFVIVASLYYLFTNKKITLMSVLPGSAITTALWTISAKVMSLSLSFQLEQMNLVYGSLSGILIVLLFFFIANVILLYGAEFNYVFERRLE